MPVCLVLPALSLHHTLSYLGFTDKASETNSSFACSVCSTGYWVDYLVSGMVVWNNKKAYSTVRCSAPLHTAEQYILCILQSYSRRNCQDLDCVLCCGFDAEILASMHQCQEQNLRDRVWGEVGKDSFIVALGKGAIARLCHSKLCVLTWDIWWGVL